MNTEMLKAQLVLPLDGRDLSKGYTSDEFWITESEQYKGIEINKYSHSVHVRNKKRYVIAEIDIAIENELIKNGKVQSLHKSPIDSIISRIK